MRASGAADSQAFAAVFRTLVGGTRAVVPSSPTASSRPARASHSTSARGPLCPALPCSARCARHVLPARLTARRAWPYPRGGPLCPAEPRSARYARPVRARLEGGPLCCSPLCRARSASGPGRRVQVRHSGEPGCVADAASRP
jgi:hypothetical protein